jgi:hypothetical protein
MRGLAFPKTDPLIADSSHEITSPPELFVANMQGIRPTLFQAAALPL